MPRVSGGDSGSSNVGDIRGGIRMNVVVSVPVAEAMMKDLGGGVAVSMMVQKKIGVGNENRLVQGLRTTAILLGSG